MAMSDRSTAILPVNEQAQARAADRLIHAVGGLAPASEYCGKSEAQLSKYSRANYAESMPISVVEELEAVTNGKPGHPHVTNYLARKAGFTLVVLPVVEANGSDLLRLLAQQAKESGDIANVICEAIADGKITADEARSVRKELRDLIRICVAMDAELELIERESE